MISVEEARHIIQQHCNKLPAVTLRLQHAAGMILATDILAPQDIPAFRQSAMDGYAFTYQEWQQRQRLSISGEITAGTTATAALSPAQAVRIFTGAPVPDGADTVVMQEKTSVVNQELLITDSQLPSGANIRPVGSEIKKNELALAKGNVLNPAAIGLLAAMGCHEVAVYRKPVIHVLVTGDELQSPGVPLVAGQVNESNSYMLIAALQQLALPVQVRVIKDNIISLQQAIANALQQCDVLILTGGVSTGDYDLVPAALAACQVQQQFHKIAQKPGKPLFFGIKHQQLIFGLPGNPAAALICFYEYIVPALAQITGRPHSMLPEWQLPLTHSYHKKNGLAHFLKGWYTDKGVTILQAQESYRLLSFARSNCLVYIAKDTEVVHAGEKVAVHLLPGW